MGQNRRVARVEYLATPAMQKCMKNAEMSLAICA
jgi:hypothetical protein